MLDNISNVCFRINPPSFLYFLSPFTIPPSITLLTFPHHPLPIPRFRCTGRFRWRDANIGSSFATVFCRNYNIYLGPIWPWDLRSTVVAFWVVKIVPRAYHKLDTYLHNHLVSSVQLRQRQLKKLFSVSVVYRVVSNFPQTRNIWKILFSGLNGK